MSDDTPTQLLPEPPDSPDTLAAERSTSKKLLITLIAVGGALLIALIVVLVLLFGQGGSGPQAAPTDSATPSDTPEPSDTPSDTPSPTATTPTEPDPAPEPDPPAPPPAPSDIISYTVSKSTVDCSSGNPVTITFHWNTTGDSVSFGVGTDFADAQPYETDLPAVGGRTIDYQCGQSGAQQKYAIAVFHNGQVIARQTMIVKEN